MAKRKIDTHQHFLPELYVDAVGLDLLNAAMPNGVAPTWSEEAAINMMDENGIDEGILPTIRVIPDPGVSRYGKAALVTMALAIAVAATVAPK